MMNDPSNILIVDDIPSNIRLMVSLLDERGFSVSYAQSGPHAIELCKKVNFVVDECLHIGRLNDMNEAKLFRKDR